MGTAAWVLVGAAAAGFVAGFFARRARFCTFGAIEDVIMTEDRIRLRAWLLAIAVAIVGVQLLWVTGAAAIGETFYLSPTFNPLALLIGGLLFGVGMAMVGNCAFGMLVRLGGGDLRALFVFLVMGLVGYATARGLPGVVRETVLGVGAVSLDGIGGQGIGHLIGRISDSNPATASLVAGLIVAAGLAVCCFRDSRFREASRDIVAGVAVGLAVTGGFWVSGGLAQSGFEPLSVRSLTYVLPPGEGIVYLLTFSGAAMTFPVAATGGTLLGVWVAALVDGDVRLEGYDDEREMKRHLFGAILMGFGGVTALGCTIGQGVSGIATLSLGAPIAMLGIVIGAVVGLRTIIAGSLRDGVSSILSKE